MITTSNKVNNDGTIFDPLLKPYFRIQSQFVESSIQVCGWMEYKKFFVTCKKSSPQSKAFKMVSTQLTSFSRFLKRNISV